MAKVKSQRLKLLSIVAVVALIATPCEGGPSGGGGGDNNPILPKSEPKKEHLYLWWDWLPEVREFPVTIWWSVPRDMTGWCETGQKKHRINFNGGSGKLTQEYEAPIYCDWYPYTYGDVITTGSQEDRGLLYCSLKVGYQEKDYKSTRKPNETIPCKYSNWPPKPNA